MKHNDYESVPCNVPTLDNDNTSTDSLMQMNYVIDNMYVTLREIIN